MLRDVSRPLHDVDIKPTAHVPRDMAMERPHAWIVRVELQNQVSWLLYPVFGDARLDKLRVATLRVREVHVPLPLPCALSQHPEVVPVQVHGVRGPAHVEEVAQDNADGGGGAEVVDVPLWVVGVGGVA